jgi:hypothetical protein
MRKLHPNERKRAGYWQNYPQLLTDLEGGLFGSVVPKAPQAKHGSSDSACFPRVESQRRSPREMLRRIVTNAGSFD